MSIQVIINLANPDPSIAPTTFQDAIDQIRLLLTARIDEDIVPYILSADTPGVENQDKVWFRLDPEGRPFGTYIFWNGLWVLEPPLLGAQIGWFAGDPTVQFDANGTGLAGDGPIANDAYGWQIMNGNSATANVSDRFIIGARMDNVGITGWDPDVPGWRTNITGEPLFEGGETTITLDEDTTYRPATSDVVVGLHDADGSNAAGGPLYGTGTSSDNTTIVSADSGNESPAPISIVNPFVAMAMIQWIGYH